MESVPPQVAVLPASASTPGLPPGAGMALLRVAPRLPVAHLADFDTAYRTGYYYSRYDTPDKVSKEAVAKGAVLLARALHMLGSGTTEIIEVPDRYFEELVQEVADFYGCFFRETPGLRCPLVAPYIEQLGTTAEARYVGILQPYQIEVQRDVRGVQRDPSRFIRAWMADHLGEGHRGVEGPGDCDPDEVSSDGAAGYVCYNASAAYVPAFSTRLQCDNCDQLGSGAGYVQWLLGED